MRKPSYKERARLKEGVTDYDDFPAFALLLTLLSQAPEIPSSHQRTITLRLLDGRNGKPLKTDEVEV